MRFIGDVHGKYKRYTKIVKECEASIQVGDFGMGFSPKHPWVYKKDQTAYENHRFIRGNHDSPSHCFRAKWWIPDGTIENGMMFVGGALSIDQERRVEGTSWWRDEQLSDVAFASMIHRYATERPSIMITHDGPEYVVQRTMRWYDKLQIESRTRLNLQRMMGFHTPKLWIFGHWHQSVDVTMYGCRFICLNELEYIDIDLAKYR